MGAKSVLGGANMKFQQWDLGQQPRGAIVEVTLRGNAANVRLLDSSAFGAFKSGRRHTYYGGHVTRSPYRVQVPRAGHWYVTVDFGGNAGSSQVGVRVLPGQLPPARQASTSPLATIAGNLASLAEETDLPVSDRRWDVFISHASEDKDEVVRPLAHALVELELTVWYDEFELRIGSSLRRSIDQGLARSRLGVVILSPSFFAKNWPQYELDGLVTREMAGGGQLILPIWHNISRSEITNASPSLADKVALTTSARSIVEIATEIAEVVSFD